MLDPVDSVCAQALSHNPYDELAYRCLPIEWTAPERLSLTSILHGGPRPHAGGYRVLELGCGDGANLLPLALYRSRSQFVGVDGAASQITLAEERRRSLGLGNVSFVHADFRLAAECVDGEFDYIIGHGIFSWVPDDARDALLALCRSRLCDGGLLYLNYNSLPGWSIRGIVRDFLMAQTAGSGGLLERAREAQAVAARVAASFEAPSSEVETHPYARLMANEFHFVGEHDPSYVAHEYLSQHNRAYWRSDFLQVMRAQGFDVVADADFNYPSGRLPIDLGSRLSSLRVVGRAVEDTIDLLCYRQLHSPILARGPSRRREATLDEFGSLCVASCLRPVPGDGDGWFEHGPSGFQVEAREPTMQAALARLEPLWPRGLPVATMFDDVARVREDLTLLHRNGLIELRLGEPDCSGVQARALHHLETLIAGYATTPYHVRSAAVAAG